MISIEDFKEAVKNSDDISCLSQLIGSLPVENRKEAGLIFAKLSKKSKPKMKPVQKNKYDLGKFKWSLDRGPFGYGIVYYENGVIIGTSDRDKPVIVIGNDVKIKGI